MEEENKVVEEVVETQEVIGETEEQLLQQQEAKYIVNVGYWSLTQTPEGEVGVEPKIQQLLFKTKKEADKKLKELQISKFFSYPTILGNLSFGIITLELVSIDKFVEFQAEQRALQNAQQEELAKQQEEQNGEGTDGSGSVEGAEPAE